MWMTSSKCIINPFCNSFFMKVIIEKQHSSLTKSITYTIASLANLIYSKILFSRIWDEVRVLMSKGFYIGNLKLFVMLSTKVKNSSWKQAMNLFRLYLMEWLS
jgi:hypothetical protein